MLFRIHPLMGIRRLRKFYLAHIQFKCCPAAVLASPHSAIDSVSGAKPRGRVSSPGKSRRNSSTIKVAFKSTKTIFQ